MRVYPRLVKLFLLCAQPEWVCDKAWHRRFTPTPSNWPHPIRPLPPLEAPTLDGHSFWGVASTSPSTSRFSWAMGSTTPTRRESAMQTLTPWKATWTCTGSRSMEPTFTLTCPKQEKPCWRLPTLNWHLKPTIPSHFVLNSQCEDFSSSHHWSFKLSLNLKIVMGSGFNYPTWQESATLTSTPLTANWICAGSGAKFIYKDLCKA